MFEEAGFPMRIYDPFYAPDERVFEASYGFMTFASIAKRHSLTLEFTGADTVLFRSPD